MAKQDLRDKYRMVRLNMDSRGVERYSLTICRRIYREIDWGTIRKICSYEPMAELKEVNVLPLLETIENNHPSVSIKLISMSSKARVPTEKFDLILVPCLAFDKNNYRLGWGGGWYDRFLAKQPRALKIGLAFQSGLVKGELPREAHDIPLDKIVTEI